MANDSTRILEIGAIVIPIILLAAGGKMVVNAARPKVDPSSSLPTPQQLDSLRGYVVRTAPVPRAVPSISGYASGDADPFSNVTRVYSAADARPAAARSAPWIVSTIMITESRRVAVVNGQVASAGSVLPGGARILSIEADHVVIAEPGGRRREVSVQGGTE